MKKFFLAAMAAALLSACANGPKIEPSDPTKYALIKNHNSTGSLTSVVSNIDGEEYFFNGDPKIVLPGDHAVIVTNWLPGFGAPLVKSRINCNTVAGYVYEVNQYNCTFAGRRTDFPGADKYWADVDAATRKKAVDDAAKANQIREANEAAKYQSDKVTLLNAKSKAEIEAVIKSVEVKMRSGIHKDDPEGLLPQAKQKLEPYLLAERKQKELEASQQAKVDAALAKEAAARQAKEQQQLASFRKSLAEGGETNCGPVIEAKGKLVKVAVAVSGYGSEHWIRRDEIFPSGYGCRFFNGQYQTLQ